MMPEQQQRILGYFIEEAKDHLNTIEQGLLSLQSTIEDPEMVNEVFRAAHSVKGGAAMLGINSVQRTSHRLEDYFKILKESPAKVDRALETMFLQVFDGLQSLLEELQGPFGLTEDKSQEVMTGLEPVFDRLDHHLNTLVESAPVAVAAEPTQPVAAAAPKSKSSTPTSEESALKLVFRSDVPGHLRTMLSLFKQEDTDASRSSLAASCDALERIGEQFDLNPWSDLANATRQAVSNRDQTYRYLAPVVIKELKQAQEKILAGQADDITVSEDLQAFIPDLAEPEFVLDDIDASLADASATADITNVLADDVSLAASSDDDLSWLESTDESAADAAELDGDDFLDSLDGLPGANPAADVAVAEPGREPAVGASELNSLADLFEGEMTSLESPWEEVAESNEADADSSSPDISIPEDFADLLESDPQNEPANNTEQDLTDLFGTVDIASGDDGQPVDAAANASDFADLFEASDGASSYEQPAAVDSQALDDLLDSVPLEASSSQDSSPELNLEDDDPLETTSAFNDLGSLFTGQDEPGANIGREAETSATAMPATELHDEVVALEPDVAPSQFKSDEILNDLWEEGAAAEVNDPDDNAIAAMFDSVDDPWSTQESEESPPDESALDALDELWSEAQTDSGAAATADSSPVQPEAAEDFAAFEDLDLADPATEAATSELEDSLDLDGLLTTNAAATESTDELSNLFADSPGEASDDVSDLDMSDLFVDNLDASSGAPSAAADGFADLFGPDDNGADVDSAGVVDSDLDFDVDQPAGANASFEADPIEADAPDLATLDLESVESISDDDSVLDASDLALDDLFSDEVLVTSDADGADAIAATDAVVGLDDLFDVNASPSPAEVSATDSTDDLPDDDLLEELPDDLESTVVISGAIDTFDTHQPTETSEEALDDIESTVVISDAIDTLDTHQPTETSSGDVETSLEELPVDLEDTVVIAQAATGFDLDAELAVDDSLGDGADADVEDPFAATTDASEGQPEASSLEELPDNLEDTVVIAQAANNLDISAELANTEEPAAEDASDDFEDLFAGSTDAIAAVDPADFDSDAAIEQPESSDELDSLFDSPEPSFDITADSSGSGLDNLLDAELTDSATAATPAESGEDWFKLDQNSDEQASADIDELDFDLDGEFDQSISTGASEADSSSLDELLDFAPDAIDASTSAASAIEDDVADFFEDVSQPSQAPAAEADDLFGDLSGPADEDEDALAVATDSNIDFDSDSLLTHDADMAVDSIPGNFEVEDEEFTVIAPTDGMPANRDSGAAFANTDASTDADFDLDAVLGDIDLAAGGSEGDGLFGDDQSLVTDASAEASVSLGIELDDTNDSTDLDDLLNDVDFDEPTSIGSELDDVSGLFTDASTSDSLDDLDALLTEDSPTTEPSEEISDEVDAVDFDSFDALLADDANEPNEDTDFGELDALLGDGPAALDAPDSLTEAPGFVSTASGFDQSNTFDELDALLDDGEEDATSVTAAGATSGGEADDEFGDLEKLLEEADQKLGGSATTITTPSSSRRSSRRVGGMAAQTMRVSVKNLDILNNLVGELVVNRNSLEQDQERLRQFLDNLLVQVQQLNDVGQRMRDLYERSLLESSLMSNRQAMQSPRIARLIDSSDNGESSSHATGATFDALEMDRFTGFHTLSQEMIELIVRVRESASDIGYTVESSDQITRQFRQVTTQLQEGLNKSRMVSFGQTADRLPRAVRDISLQCGKEARLVVEGRDTLIDKMILERLYDPMTHLVNNAITHGIETPDERAALGKPREGVITVRAFYQGNQTVIYIADDGGGINPEVVKQKAIKKGILTHTEANEMTVLDLYELLFRPGFSTRDRADDFAGRGVGMDVVRTALSEIRGSITIDSELGKGTSFTIRLPLTLSISKALSCLNNQAHIAFPMDGVEDMFDVPKERIQVDGEGQNSIQWRDTQLTFQTLSELLQFNRSLGRGRVYGGNQDEDMVSIVVLRNANTFIGLQVDRVLGEQEIVIKQLEGPVPKPMGIAGATVLGDGRVMPIADVLELIDIAQGRVRREAGSSLWTQSEVPPAGEPVATKAEPTVLIVDDSITVRELLSMSFNKVGYRVEQARDGQEAWEKMRSGLPCDLVFCDIEMPRMDGLELLSRLQKDSSLKRVPIAMLTSRGADRHRQMALDLGASGYFTKPYLEEALLDAAQRMLNGEVLLKAEA